MTELSTTRPEQITTDLLIVPVAGDPTKSDTVVALDHRLNGRLLGEVRRLGFRGTPQQELVYQSHGEIRPAAVVLIHSHADPPEAGAQGARSARRFCRVGAH